MGLFDIFKRKKHEDEVEVTYNGLIETEARRGISKREYLWIQDNLP